MKRLGEVEGLIQDKRWEDLRRLAGKESNAPETSPMIAIESIYQLLNLLSYGLYENVAEHNEIAQALFDIYETSFAKFREVPEYLFFVGYFIALNEQYFKQNDLKLSHTLLRKAFDLEPDNLLYEWGFRFSTNDRGARRITEKLSHDDEVLDSLKKKFGAGKFMMEAILNAERRFESGRIE